MPDWSWDPFRTRDAVASLWLSDGMSPLKSGAAAGYRTFFAKLRQRVVDRTITVELVKRCVTMTVTDLDFDPDLLELSVGQFGDVTVVLRDVRYKECGFPPDDGARRRTPRTIQAVRPSFQAAASAGRRRGG
jgi:hypothetical protein